MKMFIPNHDRLHQMMQETRDRALIRTLMDESNYNNLNSSTINESLNEMVVLESSISSKPLNDTPTFKRNSVSVVL